MFKKKIFWILAILGALSTMITVFVPWGSDIFNMDFASAVKVWLLFLTLFFVGAIIIIIAKCLKFLFLLGCYSAEKMRVMMSNIERKGKNVQVPD